MMIAEDLLLLLTDDETGRMTGSFIDYALAGAVLADLALMGRIRLTEKGEQGVRANRVIVVDDSPTGNDLLDDALRRLGENARFRSSTISRLYRHVRKPLQQRLVDAGVLRPEQHKFLGFPYTRYIQVDPGPELDAHVRLHRALADGEAPDPSTAALIGVLSALDITHRIVRRGDRRAMKKRAKELRKQNWAAEAAYKPIQSASAAASSSAAGAAS